MRQKTIGAPYTPPELQEALHHEYQDAIEAKRDKQQRRDLCHMLESQHWKMSDHQKEHVHTLFSWSELFNSLDRCVNEDLVRQNPLRHISSDMVF